MLEVANTLRFFARLPPHFTQVDRPSTTSVTYYNDIVSLKEGLEPGRRLLLWWLSGQLVCRK